MKELLSLKIKFCVFLCLSALSATIASAQYKPISFTRDSLPNGLQIIYQVDRSAPVVSTVMHYRVGSKDEDPARTGFAHFFEHLMFEATQDIPRGYQDKYTIEAGGELNAHTSFDETVYEFTVPANQIRLPLWIEAQRMRTLKVDTAGVEVQRGVVKEERKVRTDNKPYGTVFEKMMATLFKGGSYSWTPIGDPEHINKATISEFQKFYDNFYQPNNTCLVICGDFDIPEARKYIEAYFGGFKRAPKPIRAPFKLDPLQGEVVQTVEDQNAQLPGLFIGYRGPSLGDSSYYAVQLLSDILSSGESSRLYRELVDKEQIAVNADCFNYALQYAGMLMFEAIAAQDKSADDLQESIDDQIQLIVDKGVTDEELAKAKNMFEASFVNSRKNTLDKAFALAKFYSYYNNPGLINTEFDKIKKVTKEDIQRAAKRFLDTKNRVVLIYQPKAAN